MCSEEKRPVRKFSGDIGKPMGKDDADEEIIPSKEKLLWSTTKQKQKSEARLQILSNLARFYLIK